MRPLNCRAEMKPLIKAISSMQAIFSPCRCSMIWTNSDDVSRLDDDDLLTATWRDASLRLQAATDQHAAMTEELESLARSDPREFTPEQIWVLIRAIKVQGQILQLYLGEPVLDA